MIHASVRLKNSQPTIGVMICTVHRPGMLRRCIESVLAQAMPEGWRFEICVVENDAEPQSREVVEDCAGNGAVPVHYYQEPRRGIPYARNKTLEVALARGYGWLALIDDDEVARPDWLANFIRGAKDFNALIVTGPIEFRYEIDPPAWSTLNLYPDVPSGYVVDQASTNNAFFSTELIRPEGGNLRFDERFTAGYEDMDFFRRAHGSGHKIVWVADAIVEEEVPASRVTTDRILERMGMIANSNTYAVVLSDGALPAIARYGPKNLRRLVAGSICVVIAPDAVIEPGCMICAGAVVGTGARIGAHTILNTGCTVDHDCVVGPLCHVAPGANLAGTVTLGRGVFVGIGACVIQGRTLGDWATAGAGAAVIRDVPEGATVVGVPAREL